MGRAAAIASHVLFTAVGVGIGMAGVFLLRGGVSYLPALEGYFLPVVHSDGESAIYRDDKKACFALALNKVRSAVPIKYQFAVEARQNEAWLTKITVNAYLANDENTHSADVEWIAHEVGDRWIRHWCFELPGTMADEQPMRVSGHAIHRIHPFWNTETPLPDFVIPALAKR